MNNHTVGVVPEDEAIDEAYSMGYNRFEDYPFDPEEAEDADPLRALEHFKESAEWADTVAPRLRALAGYVDSGPGTYTVEREVVVVPSGNEDDLPRDGQKTGIAWVHSALVSAFDRGAADALLGDERGANVDAVTL